VFPRPTASGRPVPPERTLCFGRSFGAAFLSDAEFDPVKELDPSSVEIEGVAPVHPGRACRASDVDDDGFEDLECRFPFKAIDALPSLPVKNVCLHGRLLDGSAVRGCQRMTVYRVRSSAIQKCVREEHTAGSASPYPYEPVVYPLPGSRLP
jgi:hypothetical protein